MALVGKIGLVKLQKSLGPDQTIDRKYKETAQVIRLRR